MRNLKRVVVMVAAMVVALAFASSAQAGSLKGECVVQGTAKTKPAVQLVGGDGEYEFGELAFTCVGAELGKGGPSVGIITLDVTSKGVYENIVCGTGTAKSVYNEIDSLPGFVQIAGPPPQTNTLPEWNVVADNLDYAIDFAALNGPLLWTDPDANEKNAPTVDKPLDPAESGVLGGTVTILPDETKEAVGPPACTKAFQVAATLTLDVANTSSDEENDEDPKLP